MLQSDIPTRLVRQFFFCLFALKTREKVCSGSGNLFGWGCNELGQVGPNLPEFIPSPVETDSSKRVQAIAAGDCSSVSMLSGSQVFFWGSNWIKGKPGVAVKPTRVMFPRAITQISLGERHLLALADNRTVFAIGFADKGQIGTGKVRVVVVFFASVSHSGFQLQNCNDATALVFQETSTLDSVLSDQIEAVATDAEQQKSRWNNFLKRREETSSAKIVRVCCGPSFSVAVSEKGQVSQKEKKRKPV
jgi:alpha-tubulin suppressor-like RCC1 family protein